MSFIRNKVVIKIEKKNNSETHYLALISKYKYKKTEHKKKKKKCFNKRIHNDCLYKRRKYALISPTVFS
jgi:hypothetical protein